MLKTSRERLRDIEVAYHLGEGRVLKTVAFWVSLRLVAYHLGEGRVLKTYSKMERRGRRAYHLGEGRVLKTIDQSSFCLS